MLGIMHMNEYIHGGVCADNIIIFGNTNYVFNASRKVGSEYPQGYHGEADGIDESITLPDGVHENVE